LLKNPNYIKLIAGKHESSLNAYSKLDIYNGAFSIVTSGNNKRYSLIGNGNSLIWKSYDEISNFEYDILSGCISSNLGSIYNRYILFNNGFLFQFKYIEPTQFISKDSYYYYEWVLPLSSRIFFGAMNFNIIGDWFTASNDYIHCSIDGITSVVNASIKNINNSVGTKACVIGYVY